MTRKASSAPATKVGILEWFRPGEYAQVKQALKDFKQLGIQRLRTGISWADWNVPGTAEWYDWLFRTLGAEVEILPCFLYTPPSLGEEPKTSSPPRDLKAYADFLDVMITRYGEHFEWVELWNEPNNRVEYDFTLDYSWTKFARMIDMAAYWARQRGKKVLLGGMSPIDPNWLQMMFEKGAMSSIDAVGIHGFPHVFDQQWTSWEHNLTQVRAILERHNADMEVWISEVGFSTWQHDEVKQVEIFRRVINSSADRVYWYSLKDLDPEKPTVGGFHLDEREYHFGLKRVDGTPKLLYNLLERGGVARINQHPYVQKAYRIQEPESYVMITGGAGFIGTNLAARLLKEGKRVMIYDNLSRPGVEKNIEWLLNRFPENLIVQIADINETHVLEECLRHASMVYHFCAQVAVTTSLTNPAHDFSVNLRGTFNLLEGVRKSLHRPPVIFTSTNKVYGGVLDNLNLEVDDTRYRVTSPDDGTAVGINEKQPLNFQSPYGCSKGAADQYILDYGRCYGLKTAVFRMSCIYGPHQFGTEDQGWVAHFVLQALRDTPITIYGDGKQVRDILFVQDLVEAFLRAHENMDRISGQVFNIGGGPNNTVSLLELLEIIRREAGGLPDIRFDSWRTGDQQYYVSDISAFTKATGWQPRVNVEEGVTQLFHWLMDHRRSAIAPEETAQQKTLQP